MMAEPEQPPPSRSPTSSQTWRRPAAMALSACGELARLVCVKKFPILSSPSPNCRRVKILKKFNADRGHYVARCCGDLTPSRLLSGALVKGVAVAREVAQLVQSICHDAVATIGWAAAQAYRGVAS